MSCFAVCVDSFRSINSSTYCLGQVPSAPAPETVALNSSLILKVVWIVDCVSVFTTDAPLSHFDFLKLCDLQERMHAMPQHRWAAPYNAFQRSPRQARVKEEDTQNSEVFTASNVLRTQRPIQASKQAYILLTKHPSTCRQLVLETI
jgi:hypothetical protein